MKKLLPFLTVVCCLVTMTTTAQTKLQKQSAKPKIIATQRPLETATAIEGARRPGTGGTLPDSDGDGVTDQFDQEQTPAGCPVDTHGVSRDTDGDGVPDCRDKELITPTVCQPVDADGLGKCSSIIVTDTDGDGVIDQLDQEQTPQGCPVDTHGVSRDTDGDGVPDCRDKQLITPTECQPVDADGVGKCPCPSDCNVIPTMAAKGIGGDENIHEELHKQEAINKAQAQEINLLRTKLQELTTLVNSFSLALGKEEIGRGFKAFALPNPAQQYFTIRTQSGTTQPVSIRVLDATGKLVEERAGITPNSALQIGESYRTGSYLVEILQGNERATLRLLKQSN
jgi:uncharacterized protein (DUF2141 family)